MTSVFDAVEVRRRLQEFDSDVLNQLEARYVQRDRKGAQCQACNMVLNANTHDAIAEHFAFEHTRDMQRILKDRTAV
jgi:hypothetical protein